MGAQPGSSSCLQASRLLEQGKQLWERARHDQGKALTWQIPPQASSQRDAHTNWLLVVGPFPREPAENLLGLLIASKLKA